MSRIAYLNEAITTASSGYVVGSRSITTTGPGASFNWTGPGLYRAASNQLYFPTPNGERSRSLEGFMRDGLARATEASPVSTGAVALGAADDAKGDRPFRGQSRGQQRQRLEARGMQVTELPNGRFKLRFSRGRGRGRGGAARLSDSSALMAAPTGMQMEAEYDPVSGDFSDVTFSYANEVVGSASIGSAESRTTVQVDDGVVTMSAPSQ